DPALDVKTVVGPFETFCFSPSRRQGRVVLCQLTPFTDGLRPNFGRGVVSASAGGGKFPVVRNGEVRKISKSVQTFRTFPNCSDGIIRERQFRDRGSTADIFGEKDSVPRLPED